MPSPQPGTRKPWSRRSYALLGEGLIERSQFACLRIQLDWIQYKQNFREVVSVAENRDDRGNRTIMDIHVDTRQVIAGCLRPEILRAMARARASESERDAAPDRIPLEDFKSFRKSIAWQFNSLYWRRLNDWEQASGKGYEEALPGGSSDGHQPEAVAASAAEFWKLLEDMDAKKQLPQEIFRARDRRGFRTRVVSCGWTVFAPWTGSTERTSIRVCGCCWEIILWRRSKSLSLRSRSTRICAASWCWTR